MLSSRWVRFVGRALCLRAVLVIICAPWFYFPTVRPASALSVPEGNANAVAAAIESLIESKASSLGTFVTSESVSMPAALNAGTSAWAAAEAGAEVAAVGTPIGWVGLAAGAALVGAAAGTKYCIDSGCSLSWLWNGSAVAPASSTTAPPNITAGQPYYCATTSACASTAQGAANLYAQVAASSHGNTKVNSLAQTGTASSGGGTSWTVVLGPIGSPTFTPYSQSFSVSMYASAPSSCSSPYASAISASGCTASTVTPYNPAGAPEKPLAAAQDQIPLQYGSYAFTPYDLADAANEAWQYASRTPNYTGLPYPPGGISPSDVASWVAAGHALPTVGDAAQSVGTYAGSSASPQVTSPVAYPAPSAATGVLPQSTSTSSSAPNGSTGSPQAGLPPCGNMAAGEPACEVDWGQSPSVPDDPSPSPFSSIWSMLTGLFPGADNYQVPTHQGACQPGSLTWLDGSSISFQPFCDELELTRPYLTPMFSLMWIVSAVFIVMGA